MKYAIGLLLACFGLVAQAQITTVRVLTVFTNDAAYVAQSLRGQTMAQFTDTQVIDRTNAIFANSNIHVRVESAGIRSGICCGSQTHFWSWGFDPADPDYGALRWAKGSIPMMQARDETNADIVLIIANFDTGNNQIDFAGVAATKCGSLDNTPVVKARNAIAGVNIAHQSGGQDVIAHELAHVMCMKDEYGGMVRGGTNASNCFAVQTVEIAAAVPATVAFPGTANLYRVSSFTPTGTSPGAACAANGTYPFYRWYPDPTPMAHTGCRERRLGWTIRKDGCGFKTRSKSRGPRVASLVQT